jgi:hypothetical protein
MPAKSISREILLAELELHKTEFMLLKDEIAKWNDAERQFLNLSILAAGAGIGFTQIIDGQQTQIVLLLAPLVFHVFFREMLDCTGHITDISRYIIETLVPRVNTILDNLNSGKEKSKIWWYEYETATYPVNLFFFIIQPMRYWIPVSAIIALLLVYAANATTNNYPIPPFHIILIVLNLIYILSAIIRGSKSYRKFKLNSEEIRKHAEINKRGSQQGYNAGLK